MARHGSFSLRNLQHNPGQKTDFHGRETLLRAGGDWHKQFGVKQVVNSLLLETGLDLQHFTSIINQPFAPLVIHWIHEQWLQKPC